jgi:hypothetical protein
MSKLVLRLLISDRKSGLYRDTGLRIFDLKSYSASMTAVQAKLFGLISKGKFVVRLPQPVYDGFGIPQGVSGWHHDRLWLSTNGTGIVSLFVRNGSTPVLLDFITEHRKDVHYGVNPDITRLFS